MKNIVIIGGCGHIGLPLGIVLAEEGFNTSLYDIQKPKMDLIRKGIMPFLEINGQERLSKVIQSGQLHVTDEPKTISQADVIILTIGTPVDEHLNPKVHEVLETIETFIPYFKPGQTLILRSTLFPGACEAIGSFLQDKGIDISVAFCPERIAQGKALEEIRSLPQIVSALDERGFKVAEAIFGKVTQGKTVRTNPKEAELAKLFCNAWRYINFAISNQFYQIAHRAGADFSKIYEATVTEYPRMKAFAKAGFAAGPCLFKDTMQLAAFSQNTFFLGHSAMLINEGMPAFTIQILKEKLLRKDLRDLNIAILGMTFKKDSDDVRDSLAFKLRKLLKVEGANVLCHDPFLTQKSAPNAELVSLEKALQADAIIIAAPHTVYESLTFDEKKTIVDIWGLY